MTDMRDSDFGDLVDDLMAKQKTRTDIRELRFVRAELPNTKLRNIEKLETVGQQLNYGEYYGAKN